MRTTVSIDDDLLRRVKTRAAERGVTVSAVVNEALIVELSRARTNERTPLPRASGGGLRPGLSLDDNAALLDALDELDRLDTQDRASP